MIDLALDRVPALRVRAVNSAPVHAEGDYVLYWMIAQRRCSWSFALDRALDWAQELGKPLLIFEGLRLAYPWASDRMHAFVVQGMASNLRACQQAGVRYLPYVERDAGEGQGLLSALARRAAVVVTDDYPCFFLPRMVEAAGEQLTQRLEAIDSNGLLPLRAAPKVYARAVDFRRFLQKCLAPHLEELPDPRPLDRAAELGKARISRRVLQQWPAAAVEAMARDLGWLGDLQLDHAVSPVAYAGGSEAAQLALGTFLDRRLSRYAEERNAVVERATSELSPYLHFGHVAAHQVFVEVAAREKWHPGCLSGGPARGSREGWWGMGAAAESFLDELVTWRELGFNMSWQQDDYHRYESLPPWARRTLEEHAADPRPHMYDLDAFERAQTHDPLWNAAQRELLRDGRIHNYLRMLWGKKILEWTATPREALEVMIELNNRYAVDGRDPNSYSGIFWCLGRYDRAWGPERPIFGKIRYMSSDSTRRKLDAKSYLANYG